MAETEAVINVAKVFKNTLLIPLSQRGILNAEICKMAAEDYIKEWAKRNQVSSKMYIEAEGSLSCFDPYTVIKFTYMDKEWLTFEHFYQALKFMTVDEEFVESIRTAETPQVAHRRGANAVAAFKMPRSDWEDIREAEIKKFLEALIASSEDLKAKLLSTGRCVIIYRHLNESFLGSGEEEGEGRNVLGNTYMKIREEMTAKK